MKGKNLLLLEQIPSFQSRPHVKELHHPVKQTRIMQVDIALFSEKTAGAIRAGAVIRIYMVARLILS